MAIEVTGKNLHLGESLRDYVADRLERTVDKYAGNSLSGQVVIEKDRGKFLTNCAVHLRSGIDLQSQGSSQDPYASVDSALERLEKRLRRYKRRLKNRHHEGQGSGAAVVAVDYVIQHSDTEEGEQAGEEGPPVIIAETQTAIREFSVSDAVMQMDLMDLPFLVFANASHGRVNVVYRRPDGHIGWIDPGGITAGGGQED